MRAANPRLRGASAPPSYVNSFIDIEKSYLSTGNAITQGDITVRADHQMPPIIQNGDGLTSDDHFPGHNG